MTVTLSPPVSLVEWADPEMVVLVAPERAGTDPGVWHAFLRSPQGSEVSDLTLSDEDSGTREGVTVTSWRQRLGEPDQLSFAMAVNDPSAGLVDPWEVELQLERNGVLHFAGPVWSKRVGTTSGALDCQANGVLEWTKHRTWIVAGADPVNWFRNPRFDSEAANWAGPVTFDGDTETGTNAAVLDASGDRLRQVVTLDSLDFDYEIQVRARVKLSSSVPDYTPLTVVCPNTSPGAGAIKSGTAREVWTWVECKVPVYGSWDRSNQFTCTFSGPAAGTIHVDRMIFTIVNAVEVLADEFEDSPLVDPPAPPMDAARIAGNATATIRDLNLSSRAENTGIMLNTPAPGPQIIYDTIQNATRLGALEVGVELTIEVRTLVFAHRIGRDILAAELVLDAGSRDVGEFAADLDGSDLANVVYAVGSDGEYGTAANLGSFGGLELHRVVSAPTEVTDQAGRDSYAEWSLRHEPGKGTVYEAKGLPGRLLDQVDVGDRVPVTAEWGFVSLTEEPLRLVGRTIYPHSDSWDAEFNEWDPDA